MAYICIVAYGNEGGGLDFDTWKRNFSSVLVLADNYVYEFESILA